MSTTSPARRRTAALALATVAALALSACSSSITLEENAIDAADVPACEALVADLPDELFGQERRTVSGPATTTAAWGDPAVVLQCGARVPSEFDPFSSCSEIDGVGWFIPSDQLKDVTEDVTLTAQSHSPRVSISVPAEHRRTAPDTQLKVLGALILSHLEETQPCR